MPLVNEGGLDIDVTIDGTAVVLPTSLDPRIVQRKSYQETYNGLMRVDVPYDGVGMPDQPDRYEFSLDYGLDDTVAATIQFLEELRTAGGVHTFAYWKKRTYKWTSSSGQVVFYLPRPDAYSKGYSGHSDATRDKPVVKVNGVAKTVDTGSNVTSATSVSAGHVAISNTPVAHPDTGKTVSLFKFGDVLAFGDIVRVEYHPLFNVDVKEVTQKPFQIMGREDKFLLMQEVS